MAAEYSTAAGLRAAYLASESDPVAVVERALDQARVAGAEYNAVSVVDERALEAARASRARYAAGESLGPLDGVPVTVKDSFHCVGLPRWHGSAVHDGEPPSVVDSAPVRRLREAGAVLVAKTTMPDCGALGSGVSSQFGIIRNPWDPSLTPGGSSSGAGVCLAAGVTPIALGTDIAGSVRLPAAHCGLAALKPTQGRIAYTPASMTRSAGPMARCVADLEAVMEVVGATDAGDPWSLPGRFSAAGWGVERVRGMRVGLLTDVGYGLPVEPETLAVVRGAADRLSGWGAEVEELSLGLTESDFQAFDLGFMARILLEADAAPDGRGELLLPLLKTWGEPVRRASALEAARAAQTVRAARDRVLAAVAPFEIVVAPVLPVPTFPAEAAGPVDGVAPLYHAAFTAWFNQTGQPAASICGGRTSVAGMPIGVQVAGRRFHDADVLRVAHLLEAALDLDLPWPGMTEKEAGRD